MRYFVCEGSVRGSCGHKHRSARGAFKCLHADQRGCEKAGGYSDRGAYYIDGAYRIPVNCDEDGGLLEPDPMDIACAGAGLHYLSSEWCGLLQAYERLAGCVWNQWYPVIDRDGLVTCDCVPADQGGDDYFLVDGEAMIHRREAMIGPWKVDTEDCTATYTGPALIAG